jgi:hypothetical protein
MRVCAAVHAVLAVALFALAAWWAVAAFRILSHMSTGAVLTNLPAAAMLALTFSGPSAALGVWMLALARALWRGDPAARARLLRTHSLLLLPALAAVAVGIIDLLAAQRSAAHGGGLLGAIGLIPLVFGGCLAALNVSAIAAVRYVMQSPRP